MACGVFSVLYMNLMNLREIQFNNRLVMTRMSFSFLRSIISSQTPCYTLVLKKKKKTVQQVEQLLKSKYFI